MGSHVLYMRGGAENFSEAAGDSQWHQHLENNAGSITNETVAGATDGDDGDLFTN